MRVQHVHVHMHGLEVIWKAGGGRPTYHLCRGVADSNSGSHSWRTGGPGHRSCNRKAVVPSGIGIRSSAFSRRGPQGRTPCPSGTGVGEGGGASSAGGAGGRSTWGGCDRAMRIRRSALSLRGAGSQGRLIFRGPDPVDQLASILIHVRCSAASSSIGPLPFPPLLLLPLPRLLLLPPFRLQQRRQPQWWRWWRWLLLIIRQSARCKRRCKVQQRIMPLREIAPQPPLSTTGWLLSYINKLRWTHCMPLCVSSLCNRLWNRHASRAPWCRCGCSDWLSPAVWPRLRSTIGAECWDHTGDWRMMFYHRRFHFSLAFGAAIGMLLMRQAMRGVW